MKTHRYIFFIFIFAATAMHVRVVRGEGATRSPRKISKQDYRVLEKNSLHAAPAQSISENQLDTMFEQFLHGMSSEDRAKMQEAAQAYQDSASSLKEPSIFEQIMQHKEKIALGLVTVYALLAKANDWPPYDKKPVIKKGDWGSWLRDTVQGVGNALAALDNG